MVSGSDVEDFDAATFDLNCFQPADETMKMRDRCHAPVNSSQNADKVSY